MMFDLRGNYKIAAVTKHFYILLPSMKYCSSDHPRHIHDVVGWKFSWMEKSKSPSPENFLLQYYGTYKLAATT